MEQLQRGRILMCQSRYEKTMICGPNTCGTDYLDALVFEQEEEEEDDFIKGLRHVKCKLIQLVRDQLRRSHEKQVNLGCSEMNLKEDAVKLRGAPHTNPSRSPTAFRRLTSAPFLRNSRRRLRNIILLIVAIVAIIFTMHFFLIRGYFCNRGQPCVTTFRYTHAKHALF